MLKDILNIADKRIKVVYDLGYKGRLEGELVTDRATRCFKIQTGKPFVPILGSYEQESTWSRATTVETKNNVVYLVSRATDMREALAA